MNTAVFRKAMKNVRNHRDTYKAYNNQNKKELFSIRTKL